MRRLFTIFLCTFSISSHYVESGICLNEFGVFTGYGSGDLHRRQGDYEVVPLFVRFGFHLNSFFGCEEHCGVMQANVEPFINAVLGPDGGFEAGGALMLMYSYPVMDRVSLYVEGGAGPHYLSVGTVEQGSPGFNFLDQFGTGFRICICENAAVTVGYRWRHISHAGVRDSANNGINTHCGLIGVSHFY